MVAVPLTLSVFSMLQALMLTGPEGQSDVPGRHAPGHRHVPGQQADAPLQVVRAL